MQGKDGRLAIKVIFFRSSTSTSCFKIKMVSTPLSPDGAGLLSLVSHEFACVTINLTKQRIIQANTTQYVC